MKKILFLTSHIPYPPNSGDKIATFNTIKGSKLRGCQVDVLSLAHKSEHKYCQALEKIVDNVYTAKYRLKFIAIAYGIFKPNSSAIFERFYSADFEQKLFEIYSGYDVIFSHHTYMAQYLKRLRNIDTTKVLINDIHIFEHYVMKEKALRALNLFKKLFFLWESKRLANIEVQTMKPLSLNFSYGENETAELQKRGLNNVMYRPVGIETEHLTFSPIESEDYNSLLFFGDYKWFPNEDGALYLLSDLFPKLRKKMSQLKLFLVGRNASSAMKKLSAQPGVEFIGEVDDIQPWIDRCGFVLSPIRIGGGIRLKIIESMSKGKIVITNTLSAEGIIDKEALVIGDDVKTIVDNIKFLQQNSDARIALKQKARRYVLQNHSIENANTFIEHKLNEINSQ